MSKTLQWRLAIQRSDLPPTTRHVLMNLSIHMDNNGASCFPSTQTQARETGLAERTVITHIDKAVSAGFLAKGVKGRSGKGWAIHEYKAVIPNGTEPPSVPKSDNAVQGAEPPSVPKYNNSLQGTEPFSVPQDKGAERNYNMALKEIQSNSSGNSSNIHMEHLWAMEIIRLNEKDFRSWQELAGIGEDDLAEYLEGRETWLQTRPEAERARWFISTKRDIQNRFRKAS